MEIQYGRNCSGARGFIQSPAENGGLCLEMMAVAMPEGVPKATLIGCQDILVVNRGPQEGIEVEQGGRDTKPFASRTLRFRCLGRYCFFISRLWDSRMRFQNGPHT